MATTVGLFGPSNSGKTTVLLAFIHVVQNLLRPSEDQPMRVRVDGDFLPDMATLAAQPPDPTFAPDFQSLFISRLPTDPENIAQLHSAFTHQLSLYDNQGALFAVGAHRAVGKIPVHSLDLFERDFPDAFNAWEDIRDTAAGIIVLLDHTLIEERFGEEPEPDEEPYEEPLTHEDQVDELRNQLFAKQIYSPGEYARMVARLAEDRWMTPRIQTSYGAITRKIALCVSKSDLIDETTRLNYPLETIIKRKFGREMLVAINSLRATYGEENVHLSMISALGFDPQDQKANYDPGSGWLKNPDSWRPLNAEVPFFWILQQLEQEYLRFLDTATPSWARWFFQRGYIPFLQGESGHVL